MTRKDRREDYRAFPSSYTDFIELYGRDGRVELGPLPKARLDAARRDLYRWKMFLINADPEDEHARRLVGIWENCELRIEPCVIAEGENTHVLIARPNAVSEALGTMQVPKGQ